ncbi:MAG: prepilin-type N-terminal cleavage/methylation domain-containing protein [Pirellulaceae bacterium]|nr:prepilin-type N-terminal cleavage/methylation domain-containing protein [Pirellulaceae bacterium]
MRQRLAFTLIELSIVLVIIGLIVGGVLVGRDLILAAKIKKDMSSVESYDAAVNVFRLKYNGLPGDIKNAAQFGFDSNAYGNGDKRIQGIIASYSTLYTSVPSAGLRPEWFYVFHHLGQAGLIEFTGNYVITISQPLITGVHFPKMELNIGQGDTSQGSIPGITLSYEANNRIHGHFFRLGATPFYAASHFLNFYGGFIPSFAKQIDLKYDDGLPVSGRIQIGPMHSQCDDDVYEAAGQCSQGSITTSGTWLHCALAATGDYDLNYAVRSCALRVKASF